jgi:hypothetical protein
MRVKIIKATGGDTWYHNIIGQQREVIDIDRFTYQLNEPNQPKWVILKKDCEIIEDQPSFSLPPDYVVMENLHVVTPDGKRYRLVPEDEPPVAPGVKEPELNTFEDCWNKVRPEYYLSNLNQIQACGVHLSDLKEGGRDENLFPTEQNGMQIQAAIKLFVIHSALCGGMPEAVYSKSVPHWEVCFHDDIKRGIFPAKVSHGICTQFMFPTEELAQKSIDIGKDIWRTYFGL